MCIFWHRYDRLLGEFRYPGKQPVFPNVSVVGVTVMWEVLMTRALSAYQQGNVSMGWVWSSCVLFHPFWLKEPATHTHMHAHTHTNTHTHTHTTHHTHTHTHHTHTHTHTHTRTHHINTHTHTHTHTYTHTHTHTHSAL